VKVEELCGFHELADATDANFPTSRSKEENREKIREKENNKGTCVSSVSCVSPLADPSNRKGRDAASADANPDAKGAPDANPPADGWPSYQQGRLAHWQRACSRDEAAQRAWHDMQTRWVWMHRTGHPLDPTHDRDTATQELLAMGLTPSSGDVR
jgi:hypothetical protein